MTIDHNGEVPENNQDDINIGDQANVRITARDCPICFKERIETAD